MARRRRPAVRGLTGGLVGSTGRPQQQPAPTSPPPGSYDPAIDAQVGQANRGLQDFLADYIQNFGEPGTGLGGRRGQDYTLGVQGVERGFGRSLADLLTQRSRAGEDYTRTIAGVQRGFAQQGQAQTQAARAAGVARGGALAQALAKRTENERIARQPIDTGFARFGADSSLAEGRLGEDRGLALGGLRTGYLRDVEDSASELARAQRENAQFGLDANRQRLYQADLVLGGAAPAGRGERPTRRPPRPRRRPGVTISGLTGGTLARP